MFEIFITPSAARPIKKYSKKQKEEIVKKLEKLKQNPYLGEKLVGSLHFLYSYHFKIDKTNWRAAYTIDPKKKMIIIHLIGPREGFYKKLRRLLR